MWGGGGGRESKRKRFTAMKFYFSFVFFGWSEECVKPSSVCSNLFASKKNLIVHRHIVPEVMAKHSTCNFYV